MRVRRAVLTYFRDSFAPFVEAPESEGEASPVGSGDGEETSEHDTRVGGSSRAVLRAV